MPRAKIEACEKAPPANASNKPNKPSVLLLALMLSKAAASNPGKTICVPKRYNKINNNVTMILPLSSSMLHIFFIV